MTVPQVLSGAQLTKIAEGVYTVTIQNPLTSSYVGLPEAGTTLDGGASGSCVLSIQPNGEPQVRPQGAAGAYEQARKANGLLVFTPTDGARFVLPYAE